MSAKTITQPKFYSSGQPEDFERATCPRCHGEGRYNFKDCYKCARYGVVFIQKEGK